MQAAIQTRALTRHFGRGTAGVHDLDLEVPRGTIYGFLGPNGAGKTTTIRLLLGLLRPERGDIRICGHAGGTMAARATVGALVESPSLYPHLSGRDNLEVTRRLLGAPHACISAVLARVDLQHAARQRVREYSLGMRQRLGIALALLGAPEVLILDEPANGLDPAGIADLRRLLQDLVGDGLTVFLSSHLLAEVEIVAARVGVLHQGRLLFQGTLDELRARVPARLHLHIANGRAAAARAWLADRGCRVDVQGADDLTIEAPPAPAHTLNRDLIEAGFDVGDLRAAQPSLEALFFHLTRTESPHHGHD